MNHENEINGAPSTPHFAGSALQKIASSDVIPDSGNALDGGGTLVFDGSTGQVRHQGITRVTVSRPLTDNTVITYKGLPMTAKQALDNGAPLARGEDGIYRDIGAQGADATGAAPEQQQEAQRAAPEPLNTEVFAAHDAIVKAMPEPLLDAFVTSAINGGLDAIDMGAVEGAGMKREEFMGHARTVFDGLQGQADAAVTKRGADPQAVWAWARQSDPQALQRAMREHYHSGDPGAYAQVLESYFKNVPPSIEALQASGYEAWIDRTSREPVVKINGQVVKVKAAAKAGLF